MYSIDLTRSIPEQKYPFLKSQKRAKAEGSNVWVEELMHTNYTETKDASLWRAVLCRAVVDAASGSGAEKLEVAQWVEDKDDTDDFNTVCHFCGVDNEFMSRVFASILTAPEAVASVLSNQVRSAIMSYDGGALKKIFDEDM